MEFTPDGSSLISASYDTTLAFWDMKSKTRLDTLNYTQPSTRSAWQMAVNGWWLGQPMDPPGFTTLPAARKSAGLPARKPDFHSTGSGFFSGRVAAGNDAGGVWIWQAFPPPYQHLEYPTTHNIYTNAFSPDGSLLLAASGDGTARTWEVETLTEVSRRNFPRKGPGCRVQPHRKPGSRRIHGW